MMTTLMMTIYSNSYQSVYTYIRMQNTHSSKSPLFYA